MFANLYARKGFGRNALVTDTNGLCGCITIKYVCSQISFGKKFHEWNRFSTRGSLKPANRVSVATTDYHDLKTPKKLAYSVKCTSREASSLFVQHF